MQPSRYNVLVEHAGQTLVYNGVSGALLRLNPGEYERVLTVIGQQDLADVGTLASLLADLVRAGMLVPDEFDELDRLRRRYRASQRSTDELGLTVVTSLGCNFDCPYCFEDKKPSVLGPDVATAIASYVRRRMSNLRRLGVHWYGGEPLLGKRSLLALSDMLISTCEAAGVDYGASIVTNGSLLDTTTCRELADRLVRHAQITLDGPPHVHDVRRPTVAGRGTFEAVLNGICNAVRYMDVSVRINVDEANYSYATDVLDILAAEGLSGRLRVYVGQLIAVDDGAPAPSTRYSLGKCLTRPDFARVEQRFTFDASAHGFATQSVPTSVATPCTAVRAHDLVVGSRGELYKCYESVGNPTEVIGNIRDYSEPTGRAVKWLQYDPFADAECSSCFALPVCMGGCAHHAFDSRIYDNRCDTFRFNYRDRISDLADHCQTITLTRRST